MTELTPEAMAAVRQGDLIQAIKLTRDATGLDLKVSKEQVERYARGEGAQGPDAFDELLGAADPAQVPAAALAALHEGNLIEAVKLIHEGTALDLKASLDLAHALRDRPEFASVPMRSGTFSSRTTTFTASDGIRTTTHTTSSVNTGTSGRAWWVALLVAALAVLAWGVLA